MRGAALLHDCGALRCAPSAATSPPPPAPPRFGDGGRQVPGLLTPSGGEWVREASPGALPSGAGAARLASVGARWGACPAASPVAHPDDVPIIGRGVCQKADTGRQAGRELTKGCCERQVDARPRAGHEQATGALTFSPGSLHFGCCEGLLACVRRPF